MYMSRLLGGAAMAIATLSIPATAETWDMPTPYPDATFHTKNIHEFAKDIEEATGGDLAIKVHSAGSLFKHPEISKAVRSGQVPAGEFFLSLLANDNPVFGADSLPFLATSYDEAMKLWEAQEEVITGLLDEQGLMPGIGQHRGHAGPPVGCSRYGDVSIDAGDFPPFAFGAGRAHGDLVLRGLGGLQVGREAGVDGAARHAGLRGG